VVIQAGTMNLQQIVVRQNSDSIFGWDGLGNPYILTQFIGFIIFMIAVQAELTQTPFDMPIAESELVSGYMTEYSGFRFLMFFIAEFATAGVFALMCWFWSMGGLPLATAMTLNATSSLWIALHVCVMGWLLRRRGEGRPDATLLVAVVAGFLGVAAVLQPTIHADQWLHGVVGLASGALAALAYLQIIEIARVGEPEERVVFYFSIFGVVMGAAMAVASGGFRMPAPPQALALLMIGVLATIAQWMMTRAFAIGRPLVNATLQYSGIAFSFLLGVGWFDDTVTPLAVAGMILIAAAGVAATVERKPAPAAWAPSKPNDPPRSPP
jgi:S-adenosylmethionine uptake transporter